MGANDQRPTSNGAAATVCENVRRTRHATAENHAGPGHDSWSQANTAAAWNDGCTARRYHAAATTAADEWRHATTAAAGHAAVRRDDAATNGGPSSCAGWHDRRPGGGWSRGP